MTILTLVFSVCKKLTIPEHNLISQTVDNSAKYNWTLNAKIEMSCLDKNAISGDEWDDFFACGRKQIENNAARNSCQNMTVCDREFLRQKTLENISPNFEIFPGNKSCHYSEQEDTKNTYKRFMQERFDGNKMSGLNSSSQIMKSISRDISESKSLIVFSQKDLGSQAVPILSPHNISGSQTIPSSQESCGSQTMIVSSQESCGSQAMTVSSQESCGSPTMVVSSQGSSASQEMVVSSQESCESQTMVVSSQGSSVSQTMVVSSQGSSASQAMTVSSQESRASQAMSVSSQEGSNSQTVVDSSQESSNQMNVSSEESFNAFESQESVGHKAVVISKDISTLMITSSHEEGSHRFGNSCSKLSTWEKTISNKETLLKIHDISPVERESQNVASTQRGTSERHYYCRRCNKLSLRIQRKKPITAQTENSAKNPEKYEETDTLKYKNVVKRKHPHYENYLAMHPSKKSFKAE